MTTPPTDPLQDVQLYDVVQMVMTRDLNPHPQPHISQKHETVQRKRKLLGHAFIARKHILTATIVSTTVQFYHQLRLSMCVKFSIARPCQRCIKRGIGDNCTEGHRKKAKYLLEETELGKGFE